MMTAIRFMLILCILATGSLAAAASLDIVGSAIIITQDNGQVLANEALIGLELNLSNHDGSSMSIRIDGVEHDSQDPELVFYQFTTPDPQSGTWQPICSPDYDGKAVGFLLEATMTPTGDYRPAKGIYSLQCSSGASGKCVRWGYKPWGVGPNGESLWNHHQACTRMVRADYCGNGVAHTKDGTLINMYDPLGIQVSETSAAYTFEAAWGPQGAVCVRKVRWPDISSLEKLAASCPRLRDKLGEHCEETTAETFAPAMIWNESSDPAASLGLNGVR